MFNENEINALIPFLIIMINQTFLIVNGISYEKPLYMFK